MRTENIKTENTEKETKGRNMLRKRGRFEQIAAAMLAASMLAAGCASGPAEQTERIVSSSDSAGQKDTQTQTEQTEEEKDDDIEFTGTAAKAGTTDLSGISDNLLITSAGNYTLEGSFDHSIVVDAKDAEVSITLNGVAVNSSQAPALYVRNAKNVTIVLKGDSAFTTETDEILNASLYSKDDLTIEGDGVLSIDEKNGMGIKAKDTLTVNAGTLKIKAQQDGIHINEEADLSGTFLISSAEDEGIQAETVLNIRKGSYTIESAGDCLRSEEAMNIEDGTFQLVSSENEGIESKTSMVIDGGDFRIQAYDDAVNAGEEIVFNGGTFTVVSAANDGIDSNGDLIFNGGTFDVSAARTPEGPFDTDGTPFVINGGTVFGIGSSLTLPNEINQNSLAAGLSGAAGDIEIRVDGKTIFKKEAGTQSNTGMQSIFFSSPDLKTGSMVSVYAGGTLQTEGTVEQGLTSLNNPSTGPGGRQMQQRVPSSGDDSSQAPSDQSTDQAPSGRMRRGMQGQSQTDPNASETPESGS